MKKGKIINIILVLAVIVLLGILAFFVRVKPTADNVAVLKTGGMTCGSCAGRIEKVLREKPGVTSVDVDVDAGRVVVAYDSKLAKPEVLAESVTGIGYGSSVLQTLSAEKYKALTGRDMGMKRSKSGGCPCCDKK